MENEDPKKKKTIFKRVYVWITAVTGVVGTLLLAISQMDEIKKIIVGSASFVWSIAQHAYYSNDEARNKTDIGIIKEYELLKVAFLRTPRIDIGWLSNCFQRVSSAPQ